MNKVAKQIAIYAAAGALATAGYRLVLRPFLIKQFPEQAEFL
jgi:hypothetical protein